MLIGVAKGSHFKEFLSKVDEDYMEILRWICLNRGTLDEQVRMIMDSPYFNGFPSFKRETLMNQMKCSVRCIK